jgi:hypothetical protein
MKPKESLLVARGIVNGNIHSALLGIGALFAQPRQRELWAKEIGVVTAVSAVPKEL